MNERYDKELKPEELVKTANPLKILAIVFLILIIGFGIFIGVIFYLLFTQW